MEQVEKDRFLCAGGYPSPGLAELEMSRHQAGHAKISACMTSVTSGIPPTQHLFNGSICSSAPRDQNLMVDIAPPVALGVPGKHGHYKKGTLHQKMQVMFFNSRGDMSAYNHVGGNLWHVHTGTEWKTKEPIADIVEGGDIQGDNEDDRDICMPTFAPISLHRHGVPSAVVAAGCSRITMVTEHGNEMWSAELPGSPTQPVVPMDFNMDGYLDLVVVTSEGLYAWTQVRSPGGMSISALVGGLIVGLIVVLISQGQLVESESARKGRSTDRID